MHCNQSNEFFGLVRHCCYIFLVSGTRTGIGMLGVRYFGLLIFIIGLFSCRRSTYSHTVGLRVRTPNDHDQAKRRIACCMLTAALVVGCRYHPTTDDYEAYALRRY